MDFYHRDIDRAQCVPDRDRSVRVGTRIDQNSLAFFSGILNPVNQLTFVIALQKLNFQPVLRPKIAARLFDLSQRRLPVNLGLTSAKHIQIRTIQDVNCLHTYWLTNVIAYTEDHKDREDKRGARSQNPGARRPTLSANERRDISHDAAGLSPRGREGTLHGWGSWLLDSGSWLLSLCHRCYCPHPQLEERFPTPL
jgi:hypothetical protein